MAALKEHGIDTIDLLVVNLYPFEATVAKAGCTLEDAIENIDIGGPAMVRSAAKNWKDVGVLTDASQYATVLAELKAGRPGSRKTAFALSVAAFNRIAQYDGAISDYLSGRQGDEDARRMPTCPRATCSRPEQRPLHQGAGPALRREQPPAGRLVPRPAPAPGSLVTGHAAAGQGTLLQQHRRRRCRLGMREELDARLRDRQARQPCGVAVGADALEATARPSRPTHQRFRRHHRAQPKLDEAQASAPWSSSSSRC